MHDRVGDHGEQAPVHAGRVHHEVPVQIPCEVPEGSREDPCWGSGGFCAVPGGCGADSSGADTLWGRFIFKLLSKGDQLKVNLANLKFSEIGDGP